MYGHFHEFSQHGELRRAHTSTENVVSRSPEQNTLPPSTQSGFVLGDGFSQGRELWRKGWRADKVTCTAPKLPVQSIGQTTPPSESVSLDFPRDRHGSNLPLHCIDLAAHSYDLTELLSTVHTGLSATLSQPPTQHFHPKSLSGWRGPVSSSKSLELPMVTLDQASLHKLLLKSSAAACATAGYHKASSQALDTLSSVMADFMTNLTQRMASNITQCSENGQVFDDVLDQSLAECGMEGKAGLSAFWKESIIGLIDSLQGGIEKATQEFIYITDPPRPRASQENQELPPNITEKEPLSDEKFEMSLDELPRPEGPDNTVTESPIDLDEPPGVFPAEVFEGVPDMGINEPAAKRLRMISFGD